MLITINLPMVGVSTNQYSTKQLRPNITKLRSIGRWEHRPMDQEYRVYSQGLAILRQKEKKT